MTRKIIFTIVAAILMAGTNAHAEFIIDAFHTTDVANDGLKTTISSNGVELEVSTQVGAVVGLNPVQIVEGIGTFGGDVYVWEASTGQSIEFLYTWANANFVGPGTTFNDLQTISGLQLKDLPADIGVTDDWTLRVNDVVVDMNADASSLDTAIALDSLTQLSLKFTSNGPGTQELNFGVGAAGALFATPEPTSLLMLGGVGAVALLRRRKR